MTVRLSEYAQIANHVYLDGSAMPAGWVCPQGAFKMDKPFFRGGNLVSNGFQGGSYYKRDGNHLVIAFKGTVPSMATDLLADLMILIQQIPSQANSAMHYLDTRRKSVPNADVSLVGHSLGGGVCQIVGSWRNTRFVTFNAPAMGTNWLAAHLNVADPVNMVRTIVARRRDDGVNYRLLNDPVSKLGNHIGRVFKIDAGLGFTDAHSMKSVVKAITNSPTLRNLDPFG
jgi:hypothetical protein